MNPILRVGMLVIILKRLENYVGWVLELCFVYITYICVHIHTRDVENRSPNINITFYICKLSNRQLKSYKIIKLIQYVPSIMYIHDPFLFGLCQVQVYLHVITNEQKISYLLILTMI